MIQLTDNAKESQSMPLFDRAFRPFFLGGTIFAVVHMILWGLVLSGKISIISMLPSVQWHAHEMLFGFAGAIIVGFLLTAVHNWTGYPAIKGPILAFIFIIWVLARIAMFVFPPKLFWLTSLFDLTWMPFAAIAFAVTIIKGKQWRNLFIVLLLLAMSMINVVSDFGFKNNDYLLSQNSIWSMLFMVFFLITILAGRVIPFFTSKGTNTNKVQPILALEFISLIPIFVLAVLAWFPNLVLISGVVAFIGGCANLFRLIRWKPLITLSVPLLWSLHLSYLLLSLGLIVYSLSLFFPSLNAISMIHLTTIGGISGVILAMISRISLAHTGRTLTPSKWMSLAFIALALSAVVRVLFPTLLPNFPLMTYWISILCWIIGFVLFLLFYSKMLLSARLDKKSS